MKRWPILSTIAIVALSSLLACQRSAHSSPEQNANRAEDQKNPELALLHTYGWTIEGDPTASKLELPSPVDRLLSTRLYLRMSKAIGLDFSNHAGQTLPLRNYKVTNDAEQDHDIRAHLLLADSKIVGAWLSVANEDIAPGVYALNVNPHQPKQR
ncbi:MAG: DUF4830 domain-containing protein [Pyrinomonadaceae bacterium]